MKIVFTGGGTGGHFYPIIAIAQEINRIVETEQYIEPELFFLSHNPYDKRALFENHITYVMVPAGQGPRKISPKALWDIIKISLGLMAATLKLFSIYPDVVFGKGGYGSFPTLWAAKLLKIPVVIHESDAVPGKVNKWAGKFAERIAISYESAAKFFPEDRTALTGVPVRQELLRRQTSGAREFLGLDSSTPTILILGGSQGAQHINDAVLQSLPYLVSKYQVIHQVGSKNVEDITGRARIVLEKSENASRYKVFGFLDSGAMAMSAGAAQLVITRAGSTALTEVAHWGLPSIVIPIPEDVSHDQTKNGISYARTGAGTLLEERNLTSHILSAEVDRILQDPRLAQSMSEKAKLFAHPDAAEKLAREILNLGLRHEK